jgi:hypothetical protein
MSNSWFQYNGSGRSLALYNSLVPQIELTGLNSDSTYILRMSGSDGGSFVSNPTEYTVAGHITYSTQNLNIHDNLTQGVTFTGIQPDSTGMIRIYINATGSTDIAGISGLQVFTGSSNVGLPSVAISSPANGTILPEDGNVVIQATASETGATIAKVEFFADTTKIGEVDTVPYTFTWVDPDPGAYTITARATDNVGTINNASVSIAIQSLNYFWSTTGNAGNNPDSTFIGNVDSVRLDFRTKDIQRMSITATGNIGIGTILPTAQLHVVGTVRMAGLSNDSTNADPRIVVSDTLGNLAYRNFTSGSGGLVVGPGLGETPGGSIALGDTIPGSGPHSFTSNRYEYLNGYRYSIGGSVNDPVNAPNFLLYDNGDWTAGTTMDRSVNTLGQTGIRYYSKPGVLQLGGSDWLDTTESKIVYGTRQGSGLLINSDSANTIKGKLMNTVFLGDANTLDSTARMENTFIAAESSHFTSSMDSLVQSYVGGSGHTISAPLLASVMSGKGNTISHYSEDDNISGYQNTSQDSTCCGLIAGSNNQFGGLDQLVSGQYLINRTPFGATVGNANVDFSTLPYTGWRGTEVANIGSYPLFVLANSSDNTGAIRSNAMTVLFNGRTQINTTGFSNSLSQSNVTPKAALEVVSTNTGVLLPKLTTTQRNAIASGDLLNGLLLYNTDSNAFQYYNGSSWQAVGSNAATGGWASSGNSGTNPATNFVGTTDTQRLVFRTDDIERMTILNNGAVGIGTSSVPADGVLAVNGTIYTTKVKVTQIGWPDYVLDRRYTLPSLAAVERYIRLHHHLPGVVSEGELTGKRLDLGENEAVLLRKIEELTLYLLAEHKKAEDQEVEIGRLEEENRKLGDQQQQIDQLKEMVKKLTAKTK